MEIAVRQAYEMGLKNKLQIIVPNLTIDMAQGAGPEAMAGIIGATPWFGEIPFTNNYQAGKAFVMKFESKYQRYPTTSAASAYVILHQYREAVERARSFETIKVIKTLEGYRYTRVKDEQYWRAWDHQSRRYMPSAANRQAREPLIWSSNIFSQPACSKADRCRSMFWSCVETRIYPINTDIPYCQTLPSGRSY